MYSVCMRYAAYSVQYTVCSACIQCLCAVCVHSVCMRYAAYSVQYTVCSACVQCLYTVCVYSVCMQYTVYSVQYTVCSACVQCLYTVCVYSVVIVCLCVWDEYVYRCIVNVRSIHMYTWNVPYVSIAEVSQ